MRAMHTSIRSAMVLFAELQYFNPLAAVFFDGASEVTQRVHVIVTTITRLEDAMLNPHPVSLPLKCLVVQLIITVAFRLLNQPCCWTVAALMVDILDDAPPDAAAVRHE